MRFFSRLMCVFAGISIAAAPSFAQVPSTNDTSTSDGNFNTGSGSYALSALRSGYYNTAFGYTALGSNTEGYSNTAVGLEALYYNSTGYSNVAVGFEALQLNTVGYDNSASGYSALYSNTTGYYNTANGFNALYSNTDGFFNTATGYQALYSNTHGQKNFGDGVNALYSNTTGNLNTAFGVSALYSNTTGSYNIGEGYHGGYNLTTGSNNIDIGNAGVAAESGIIRIGTSGTQTAAYISGINSSKITGAAVYVTSSGQLGVLASSERYKTQINSLGSQPTEKLAQLRPVSFHLKSQPNGPIQYGLIAEEVNKIYPELVIRDDKGVIQGVRYDELAPLLLDAMQADRKETEALRANVRSQADKLAAQSDQLHVVLRQFQNLKEQNAMIQKKLDALDTTSRVAANTAP